MSGDNKEDELPCSLLPSTLHLVLVIGPSKSGKTSLLSRYASRTFNSDYIVTIGADYTKRDVTIPSKSGPFTVRLQVRSE